MKNVDIKDMTLIVLSGISFFFGRGDIASSSVWLMTSRDRTSYDYNEPYLTYVYKVYKDILKSYVDVQRKLNFYNCTDAFALYNYMYKNGYFSYDKKFTYCVDPLLDNLDFLGIDVIVGCGCCRNISQMFHDILSLCGYNNNVLTVNSEIKEKKCGIKLFGNHCINMIMDYDNAHYFDPTNMCIFDFNGREFLNDRLHAKKALIDFDSKVSLLPSFDIDEDYKMYETSKSIILSNLDVLNKFYDDNKDKYSDIHHKCIDYAYNKKMF